MPKSKKKRRPDYLVLFTGYSKRLIKGREANVAEDIYPIHGFDKYTKKVRILWDAAEKQNPYAIWFLKRISDKLNETEKFIEQCEKEANDRFNDGLEIDYRLYNGTKEDKYQLNLKPPYSWSLARLIKRCDAHFLVLFKQNSIGLIKDREMHLMIDAMSKSVLAVIRESIAYYDFELTYKDIENSTAVYSEASEKMGVIPPVILSGDQKADFLPRIKAH